MTPSIRRARLLLPAMLALLSHAALAEPEPIRIAKQFGISYLPLIVMQEDHLLEAEGHARGLDLAPSFVTIGNGGAINDMLISGNLDFASGGVSPMLIIWNKTRTNLKVKGVAALNAMPVWLNTRNPKVLTVKDFTEADRIALPGVKFSLQAVVLQMAVAQAFGQQHFDQLDTRTVSLSHPDGYTALMGFKSEIDSHFTSAPFQYQELADPRIHRVLNSYDVLGGPHSFNVVWATQRFHDAHPKEFSAFLAALADAEKSIVADPDHAASLYIRNEHSKDAPAKIAALIRLPENQWTMVPQRIMQFASFMHQTGAVSGVPTSWKDIFFPEIDGMNGN